MSNDSEFKETTAGSLGEMRERLRAHNQWLGDHEQKLAAMNQKLNELNTEFKVSLAKASLIMALIIGLGATVGSFVIQNSLESLKSAVVKEQNQ
jgi:hypothetical protein